MKKSSMKSIVVASTLVPSLLLHSIPPAFASDTNNVADNTNSLLTQTLVDEQFEEQVKADQEYHKQVYEQLLNESREAERDFQYQENFLNEQNQSNVSQESVLGTQAVTKSFLRGQWNTGASILISSGFVMTGTFLRNSLNDNASRLMYPNNSSFSNSIKYSPEFQKRLTYFQSLLSRTSSSYYSQNSSFSLENNKDQFLALHNVGVQFAAQKSNGTWNIIATVNDVYNFEYWNYTSSNGLNNAFVTLVNNYAADSQRLGAIVPYSIAFYIQSSFH